MHKLITKKTNHTQNPREQNACEWETHPHTGIPIIMGSFHRRNVFLFFYCTNCIFYPLTFTFTFMHLADAFIQSDLQCIQAIHVLSVSYPSQETTGIFAFSKHFILIYLKMYHFAIFVGTYTVEMYGI